MFDCQADVLTLHRRRSGLRRDVMAVQMSASGQKQLGSMPAIANLSKCVLMADWGLRKQQSHDVLDKMSVLLS
ncbi:MAG: hypothetical protein ACTTJD_05630 [Porphyromonadaceae bacterium]